MRRVKVVNVIITLVVLVAVVGAIVFFTQQDQKLVLVGENTVTVSLNTDFKDQGVNVEEASVSGEVDTHKVGEYTLTYIYKDQTITRTVKVVDDRQMIMNLNGSQDSYVYVGDPYIESGCHVIDKTDGDLTSQVKTTGTVDTSKKGDYKITYQVTNSQGTTMSKERVVHVDNFDKNTTGIPVLMYHYVYTDQDVPKKLNVNYIKDTAFEEQLKYLKEQNYYFISYQELNAYVNKKISLPKKSIILSFDDGQIGFLKYGIPLLEKYEVPATSFFIASKKGEEKIKTYASEYISFQSHSYDMHKAGGNIGHGGIISAMTTSQITADLKKAQSILQNTEAFAYPYGDVTEDAKTAVQQANILCAFTTKYGKVKPGMDYRALPRIRVTGTNSLKAYIASIE